MKMLKKILLGTLVLATALAFTSCGLSEDQEKAISSSGKVNYTNDSTKNFYRSWVATKTKHLDADAIITIEDADNYVPLQKNSDNTPVVAKGVFGFIFGLEEVTNKYDPVKKNVDGKDVTVKFYDFGIAGVRWNAADDKVQWYVSWCKNVPNTVFNFTDSSGFADEDLPSGSPAALEKVVLGWTDIDTSDLNLDIDNNLAAIIKTQATDTGGYTVNLCTKEGRAISTANISNTDTGYPNGKIQRLIGRYITVYKNQTLKGSIKYDDINAGVIPEDDVGIVLE